MGDPKFRRRQYDTPTHPWQRIRIQEEEVSLRRYGLRNKRELWKAQTQMRKFRGHARNLLARLRYGDKQAERETKELLGRLARLGILSDASSLDDVLGLEVNAPLSRRFQTIIYLKGLAYTPNHARQLIVHGHASVGGRKVTIPGYYVPRSEEETVSYHDQSPLVNDLHPARPNPEETQERIDRRDQEAARKLEALLSERPGRRGRRSGPPPRRRPPPAT